MVDVGQATLEVDRWTPFVITMRFRGINLTGATLRAQVRLTADTPGTPLVDLPTVATTNTEGLRIVSVDTVNSIPTTTVQMRINEATIEALPHAAERGDDVELAWDLHITTGAGKQRRLAGPFIVRAGVTQA